MFSFLTDWNLSWVSADESITWDMVSQIGLKTYFKSWEEVLKLSVVSQNGVIVPWNKFDFDTARHCLDVIHDLAAFLLIPAGCDGQINKIPWDFSEDWSKVNLGKQKNVKIFFLSPKKSTRTVLLQICHMVQNLCAFEKKKNKHPSSFCPLVLLEYPRHRKLFQSLICAKTAVRSMRVRC